ncbi:MAG TPA: replicative helicase loader/inhibitor [Dissulfurispiraceae bacterium]|nr:replicative helicase loader/inhibitor [Dissulfurispiraceae bacterium]
MATEEDILELLSTLKAAYPAWKPGSSTPAMLDLWNRKLADFEPAALRQAIDRHIDGSNFFPSLHELITLARYYRPGGVVQKDELRERMLMLEDMFYTAGEISQTAWGALVVAFYQSGRKHGAIHAREKFSQFAGVSLEVELELVEA